MADSDFDRQTRADEYEPEPLCLWCNDPMPQDATYGPYCSSLCALSAEHDSEDR